MRTSISVSGSRLDASSESAVMLASRSRTGVSVVDSDICLPFGRTLVPDHKERLQYRRSAHPGSSYRWHEMNGGRDHRTFAGCRCGETALVLGFWPAWRLSRCLSTSSRSSSVRRSDGPARCRRRPDRTTTPCERPSRERGRAGGVRQDDTPRPLGRGRSALICVGGARRTRRRPVGTTAVHRGGDSSGQDRAVRGVRCAVRSRGVLAAAGPARSSEAH